MALYQISFSANKVKGKAPCTVIFYPTIEIASAKWQDTDSATTEYQDSDSGSTDYQEND